ncbi:FAD-dependent oxidoreductase [Microlunatus speluncae]|uniref:FAD-dependent oxidoreductase n=1 Tax=Microlunatus speluncae TaxID=2594267 RepID=UPI00126686A4|nr:FAD-dependent oxidoreductase [Microlunatus speluncae]
MHTPPTSSSTRTGQLHVAPAEARRDFRTDSLEADLVVVGGGMAGTCAAITAARAGVRVILVQDRPVLGGNASSEVRLWVLGATAHMGNNNRWAREGGVVDEIIVENTYRNRDGNSIIFDTILLEKVTQEPLITLLLNTAMVGADVADGTIRSVSAFCSQNSTRYELTAPLFLDSTGDGALAFSAGAAFRMGAEASAEFGEPFAPTEEYGPLLGHSMYFYSKDVGHPVRFVPPSYALDDLSTIPRARSFNTKEDGCRLWWIEWGGRLDTVHDTELIKWELWKVIYGVWNHLKNSGEFPDAENLTLEWVGHVPGKRESRRFEGLYMLRQSDILEQRLHHDGVAFGGWSIDLHPADGVFSEHPGSNHLHARGTYQIPYRCLVSADVANLFLAGRLISASHVAFGSTRVMGTGAHMGQAVGVAAALCLRDRLSPAELATPERTGGLRRELLRRGQHLPGVLLDDPDDLTRTAMITASSEARLTELPDSGQAVPLDRSRGQLLPLAAGPVPQFGLIFDADHPATVRAELRVGLRPDDYTCDIVLAAADLELRPGSDQPVKIDFDAELAEPGYVQLSLLASDGVAVHVSDQLITGTVGLRHKATQEEDAAIGRPRIEFWTPERRPTGRNLALRLDPAPPAYPATNVGVGADRPTSGSNAWVAAVDDPAPRLELSWPEAQPIGRVELSFDTDFDHPMESALYGHPESEMPFCVRDFRVLAGSEVLAEITDNHQSRRELIMDPPVTTDRLSVEVLAGHGNAPAAIFSVRCYADPDPRIQRSPVPD